MLAHMLHEAGYTCASCGEWNDTTVDPSAGDGQSYVEDCQVCCRPNLLEIWVEPEHGAARITARFEG